MKNSKGKQQTTKMKLTKKTVQKSSINNLLFGINKNIIQKTEK